MIAKERGRAKIMEHHSGFHPSIVWGNWLKMVYFGSSDRLLKWAYIVLNPDMFCAIVEAFIQHEIHLIEQLVLVS